MTIEQLLKNYIKEKYYSIRQFTIKADMPYSTVDTMLKRGLANSSVVNVNRICAALHISADALAHGEIIDADEYANAQTKPGEHTIINIGDLRQGIEVVDILEDAKKTISTAPGVTLDGKPITVDSMRILSDMLDAALEMARKRA